MVFRNEYSYDEGFKFIQYFQSFFIFKNIKKFFPIDYEEIHFLVLSLWSKFGFWKIYVPTGEI